MFFNNDNNSLKNVKTVLEITGAAISVGVGIYTIINKVKEKNILEMNALAIERSTGITMADVEEEKKKKKEIKEIEEVRAYVDNKEEE